MSVLVGGFDKSFALQPISVSGNSGAGVSAGVQGLRAALPRPDVTAMPRRLIAAARSAGRFPHALHRAGRGLASRGKPDGGGDGRS
ncbi:MAG: DUF992 domain-containing protein [Rhodobacteraceae bacterium]|nr:DUF992 domain-containing protein [Paracoccaceae bacterium]